MFRTMLNKITFGVLLTVITVIHAEVHTGIFSFPQPLRDDKPLSIDFSSMPGLVSFENPVSIAKYSDSVHQDSADIIINQGHLKARRGIISASVPGFFENYIHLKQLLPGDQTLFYLDSIVKKEQLLISFLSHSGAFSDSTGIYRDSLFLLKTAENNFVVMILVYTYIGGIDRFSFYWIHQTGTDSVLFKNNFVKIPDSLKICPSIFSGRPDPVFVLRDPALMQKLLTNLNAGVNQYLNPSLESGDLGALESSSLGLRKISIYGFDSTAEYPRFELAKGILAFLQRPLFSSSIRPICVKDVQNRAACIVFKSAIEANLQSTDQYGTIYFANLFSDHVRNDIMNCKTDSLWSHAHQISTDIRYFANSSNNYEQNVSLAGRSLIIASEPGLLNVTVTDINGKVVDRLRSETNGTCNLNLKGEQSAKLLLFNGTLKQPDGSIKTFKERSVNLK